MECSAKGVPFWVWVWGEITLNRSYPTLSRAYQYSRAFKYPAVRHWHKPSSPYGLRKGQYLGIVHLHALYRFGLGCVEHIDNILGLDYGLGFLLEFVCSCTGDGVQCHQVLECQVA